MKPLYEISNEYLLMLDEQVTEDGEIKDLSIFEGDLEKFNDKAIAVSMYFNNLDAEANAIRDAEKMMKARRETLEKRSTNLREYLKSNMQRCGISEIKSPYLCIKLQKNPPSVNLVDESVIPDIYKTVEVATKISKTEIKAAIQAGIEVPGAQLIQDERLKIS